MAQHVKRFSLLLPVVLYLQFANSGLKSVQAQAATDFLAFNYSINANSDSREKMAAVTGTLEKIMVGYNMKLRPDIFGPPTIIWINVLIVNIAAVSEVNMEFQVDLYLRQKWRDDRLDFSELLPPDVSVIHLHQTFLKDVWTPDTYFWNEKAAEKLEPVQLVRLYRNGTLQTSTRITLTAACELHLGNFPMDNQECGVDFGSFAYSTEQLEYEWENGAVQLQLEYSTLPQFKIKAYKVVREEKNFTTGIFEKFSIQFLFLRLRTFYIFQVYVPSVLVVIVAYFALWMGRGNQDLLGARLGLCITSVLTMTTVYTTVNSNSPPVSYVKALDVYLAICFVGVFVTMLQSAMIVYLRKKLSSLEEEEGRVSKDGHFLVSCGVDPKDKKSGTGEGGVGGAEQKKELKRQKRFLIFLISRMDVVCRTTFPLIFGAFNLAYWTYYLSQTRDPSQNEEEGWKLSAK